MVSPRDIRNSYFCEYRVFGSSILNHLSRRRVPIEEVPPPEEDEEDEEYDDPPIPKQKWVGGNYYPGDWDLITVDRQMDIPVFNEFFKGFQKTERVIMETARGKVIERSYGPWKFNLINFRSYRDLVYDILECEVCYLPALDRFESTSGNFMGFPKSWRMNVLHYRWVIPRVLRKMGSVHLDYRDLIEILKNYGTSSLIDDVLIENYLTLQRNRRAKYERFCEINSLKMVVEKVDRKYEILSMITFHKNYYGGGTAAL